MSIDWKAEYEAEHERRLADKASIAALAAENDFVRAESDLIDEKVELIRSLEAALLRHGHKDGSCGLCTALETKSAPGFCPECLMTGGHKLRCSKAETPVSTLCAICDQIKELHPSTHEWTAKETKGKQDG